MKEIQLTQGKVALVDDSDFDYLNQWKWWAVKSGNTFYAKRGQYVNGKMSTISMHRVILELADSEILADHIDKNGLNNQRNNLRRATKYQNNVNRRPKKNGASKFLGVNWLPSRQRWKAEIRKNGVLIHLGRHKQEKDAALAYNKAAIEIHGEFASLNDISE